jgi:uncharacterized protein involved in exopolysaccharide biosynthesis
MTPKIKPGQQVEEDFGFPSERLLSIPPDTQEPGRQNVERARVLWEQRRFLSRITGAGLVLAALIAILLPSQYTSTVRMMPPDQESGTGVGMLAALAGKAAGPFGGLGAELLGLKTSGDLFVGILQSRTVQNAIINKIDLRKAYGIDRWDETRKLLATRTTISQDRKSGILTIAVSDRRRDRAKAIAEEYVLQLNELVTSLNTSSAHRERAFLEERLKGVQGDLDSAQKEFSQFASRNTTIDLQAQSKAMIEAGASLAGELAAAQTELEGLRQIYASGNVRVRAVQARVDELRRQLEKIGGPSPVDQSRGAAPAAKDPNSLYPPIRELPLLGVTYADLFRRVKVQEAVYETLTQEYELAKVQEAKETPSVKILDPADLPERKSFPPRAAIILIGTVLAFVAGSAWIFGTIRWDNIDPQHPGKLLVLEVLQTIPVRWTPAFRRGTIGPTNGNGSGSSLA